MYIYFLHYYLFLDNDFYKIKVFKGDFFAGIVNARIALGFRV